MGKMLRMPRTFFSNLVKMIELIDIRKAEPKVGIFKNKDLFEAY